MSEFCALVSGEIREMSWAQSWVNDWIGTPVA